MCGVGGEGSTLEVKEKNQTGLFKEVNTKAGTKTVLVVTNHSRVARPISTGAACPDLTGRQAHHRDLRMNASEWLVARRLMFSCVASNAPSTALACHYVACVLSLTEYLTFMRVQVNYYDC